MEDFQHLAEDRSLIFYDLRNRGWSDAVNDASKLSRGIHNEVDDLEVVRRYFGLNQIDLNGDSYLGLMVILYSMKYPRSVHGVMQWNSAGSSGTFCA